MSDNAVTENGGNQGSPLFAVNERKLDASSLIKAIHAHRRIPTDVPGYWDQYCTLIKSLCRANAILFAQRSESGDWQVLGRHCQSADWLMQVWNESIIEHGDRSLANGFAFVPLQDDLKRLHILTMIRANGIKDAVLLLDIPERERAQVNEIILRALLATDFPESHPEVSAREPSQGSEDPSRRIEAGVLDLLDLAAQVMNEERFNAAVLVLTNGLAAHYGAAQAALGWLHGESIRVVAVSHLDRFERNTQIVRLLEDSFFETLGEGGEVWFPDSAPVGNLLMAQEELRSVLGIAEQVSLPIRDGKGTARALVFIGFQAKASERPRMADLLLVMELLTPWLQYLKNRDRWWGARALSSIKSRMEQFLGPGHGWRQITALLGSALLLFILFGKWDYRIEAMSQLTTDSTRFISAQYDGRVEEVFATAGDMVKEGAVLAALDTKELRQQEIDIRAERERLSAEADKSRAAGNLAELEIAQARFAQADARLNRVLLYLGQSKFIAPFDGVIVDGERKDLLNAPVKKGDKLFRLARIDGFYIELLVPERDIRYVKPDATGELRLLSRPDQKIPFKLSVFIPMAQVKGQEGNHFLVKARLEQAPEEWWRTGMSGTALIDGGKQNIAWILTHRAIDTLRMKLWWFW